MKRAVIVAVTILVLCSIFPVFRLYQYHAEDAGQREAFEALRQIVIVPGNIESATEEVTSDIAALRRQNRDCIGWLKVPGATIDYPVMQSTSDPEYYLKHDFEGNDSSHGVPFVDSRCSLSGSDNLIIYGHQMHDGSMFSPLLDYEDGDFYRKHQTVELFLADRKETYRVFAVLRTPGATEQDEWSIDFGVKLLKGLLQQANVASPADLDHLKLAVQAYNYGSGYIGYALAMDGKYTRENAVSFAQRQAGILGWSSYGDVDYVDHVLRYYTVGSILGTGAVSQRYPTLCYPMPGYGWTTYSGHEGIDLPCELGTPVYASGSGTITYVKNGWTEADGKSGMMSYGNCVCISHDNGLQTRYGHLSYSIVQSGQMVFQGQLIGYSGSTGNSTGPHMHFSIYDNGNPGSGGYSNNAALAFPNERQ